MRLGMPTLGLPSMRQYGGGTPAPTPDPAIAVAPLGINGSYKRLYYSGKILDENLALYDNWKANHSGGSIDAYQPHVDRHGNLTTSPASAGFLSFQRGIIAPRAAGNKVRITFTVVGTPTITIGGGVSTGVSVDLANGVVTYTSTTGSRVSGQSQLVVSGNGYITNVDARDCGTGSTPLYPTAEFAPDMVAEYKSLYRGAYYRGMDETNGNDYIFGAQVGAIRTDWADRNMGNGWAAPPRREARATFGTGNSGFRLYVRHVSAGNTGNSSQESWGSWQLATYLYPYLPFHPYGAAGNNVTVILNAPSGPGTYNMTVDGSGNFTATFTPPSTATTTALVVAWINSDTTIRRFFAADLYNHNGTAALGNGSGAPITSAGTMLTGGYFEGVRDGIGQEKITRFCIEAEMRPWYIVPASASVDYVQGLAQHIADELPESLWPCVIEFIGNESTWNDGFPNHYVFRAKGLANNSSDTTPADTFCASQAVAMRAAIDAILPSEAFRAAYNTQNASTFHFNRFIGKPGIVNAIDDIAIAPYFHPQTYAVGSGETADEMVDDSYDSLLGLLNDSATMKALAEAQGMRMTVYETGQHTRIDINTSSTRRIDYHRHPRQAYVYGVFFAEWIRRFNTPVLHYLDVYPLYQSNLGFGWGLEDSMGEWLTNPSLAPKKEGYVRVINGHYPPYAALEGIAPAVTGARIAQSTLTLTLPTARNGTWSVQWTRRNGGGSTDIPGATGLTYVQTADDVGFFVEPRYQLLASDPVWDDLDPVTLTSAVATEVYKKYVAITTTGASTWTVPADAPANVTVHVVGAGGRGRIGNTDTAGGRAGGGGGAYAQALVAVTPGVSVNAYVAAEGSGQDTWFGSSATVMAKPGVNATSGTGAAGGSASSSIGTTKFSGGSGGTSFGTYQGCGGGGGAAGPAGAGAAGGYNAIGAGGGGGANGGGAGGNGQNNVSVNGSIRNVGGSGGIARDGTAGGTRGVSTVGPRNGGNGANGSGGGGAVDGVANGGNGSTDAIWSLTSGGSVGPGSGGGGGADNYGWAKGGSGGQYGGGSGGGTNSDQAGTPTATAGQGLIVIEYEPAS